MAMDVVKMARMASGMEMPTKTKSAIKYTGFHMLSVTLNEPRRAIFTPTRGVGSGVTKHQRLSHVIVAGKRQARPRRVRTAARCTLHIIHGHRHSTKPPLLDLITAKAPCCASCWSDADSDE